VQHHDLLDDCYMPSAGVKLLEMVGMDVWKLHVEGRRKLAHPGRVYVLKVDVRKRLVEV